MSAEDLETMTEVESFPNVGNVRDEFPNQGVESNYPYADPEGEDYSSSHILRSRPDGWILGRRGQSQEHFERYVPSEELVDRDESILHTVSVTVGRAVMDPDGVWFAGADSGSLTGTETLFIPEEVVDEVDTGTASNIEVVESEQKAMEEAAYYADYLMENAEDLECVEKVGSELHAPL